MEKDKSTNHVGASLPPSAWHSVFPPTENNFNGISEILPPPSGWHSVLPPTENNINGISESLPPPPPSSSTLLHTDPKQSKNLVLILAMFKDHESMECVYMITLNQPCLQFRVRANRQSTARSKEKKMQYISKLERKISSLETESSLLSNELTMLERISSGMTAEIGELKVLLQSMEQLVHLHDASTEAPKKKAQHLKVTPGQANAPNMGQMMNFPATSGSNQQFYPSNNAAFNT